MGLRNSASTFQRLLNQILSGLNYKILFSYIDDIIVFSETIPEHIERLRLTFDRIENENLRLKASKCKFLQLETEFLGFTVSSEGVKPNPVKLQVIKDYPIPKSARDVKSFLGLVSYFRRSVKDFSKIANPLYSLTKADTKFTWDDKCQGAFETLRNKLLDSPTLKFPDFENEFSLHSDASVCGLGFFLTQMDENGVPAPVGFGGRSLNKHEKNYPIHELELLALVSGIKYFHQYLTLKPFKIYCDSQSVVWLLKQKETRGRLARWIMELSKYDFEVFHKPGKENLVADALSRSSNLPEVCSSQDLSSNTSGAFPLDKLRQAQREDQDLLPIINFFQTDTSTTGVEAMKLSLNFVLDENDILYFVRKNSQYAEQSMLLAVPRIMVNDILVANHDDPSSGHMGIRMTRARILEKYWWKGMYKDIKRHVDSCSVCARMKPRMGTPPAPLVPLEVEDVFHRWQIDHVGPTTKCKKTGCAYVLVMTECLTNYTLAEAVENTSAELTAHALFNRVVCVYGLPHVIQSDNAQGFNSKLLKEFLEVLRVKKINSSAYAPRTQGCVERRNGVLIGVIRRTMEEHADNWTEYLSCAVLAINTSPHTTLGLSPYQLIFGKRCRTPHDLSAYSPSILKKDESEILSNITRRITSYRERAMEIKRIEKIKMKMNYDERAKARSVTYDVGDKILIKDMGLHKKANAKWAPKYIGPFIITERVGPVTYRVDTKHHRLMKDCVHVDRIKKWIERAPEGEIVPNTPTTRSEYVVVNHRRTRRDLMYLIQEKNASIATGKWVNADNATYQSEIAEYLKNVTHQPQTEVSASSLTAVPAENRVPHGRRFLFFPSNKLWLLMAMLITLVTGVHTQKFTSTSPAIGPLLDCEKVSHKEILAIPSTNDCEKTFQASKLHKFIGEVRQYVKQVTPIRLFYCSVQRVSKVCSDGFFGQKTMSRRMHFIPLSQAQCMRAMLSKITSYGKLYKSSPDTWETHTSKSFKCSWLRKLTESYVVFKMREIVGSVEGENHVINQDFTRSECSTKRVSCVPLEQKSGMMVWNRVHHNYNVYRSRGEQVIYQLGNFYLLSESGIAGTAIKTEDNLILLENSYVIKRRSTTPSADSADRFMNFSKSYAAKTVENVERELLETKITEQFIKNDHLMKTISTSLCRLQTGIRKLQMLNVRLFTDSSHSILFNDADKIAIPKGDVIMVGRCRKVFSYEVVWNQTLGDKCFNLFPLLMPDNQTKFLVLNSRRIFRAAQAINCSLRPSDTYVRDIHGEFWRYTLDRGFSWVNISSDQFYRPSHLSLPNLGHFNPSLLHSSGERLPRPILLEALNARFRELNELGDLTEQGQGDFLSGVGAGLANIAETLVDTGENVFKIFAKGTVDVSNATASSVSSIGNSIAGIFSGVGGISNCFLYVLNFLVVGYLVLKHFRERHNFVPAPRPAAAMAGSLSPLTPPIPVRSRAVEASRL